MEKKTKYSIVALIVLLMIMCIGFSGAIVPSNIVFVNSTDGIITKLNSTIFRATDAVITTFNATTLTTSGNFGANNATITVNVSVGDVLSTADMSASGNIAMTGASASFLISGANSILNISGAGGYADINQTWKHYSYPASCSDYYGVSVLGDANTCSDWWVNINGDNMTGHLNMTGYNITNIGKIKLDANSSALPCDANHAGDIMYNGTNHLGCNSTDWNALY